MKKFVSPITEGNFVENWEYVVGKLTAAKKKRILEKIVKIVGNLAFLAYLFVITFGVLQGMGQETLTQYLKDTPILAEAWQAISWLVYYPSMHWGMQIFIYVISAYLFTLLVCGIVSVLFWLLYRPKRKKERTEELAADSKELYRMARAAWLRAGKPSEATSTICNLLYVVGVMLYVINYVVHSVAQGFQGTEKASLLESLSGYGEVLAVALICVASYSIWNLILGYLLLPIYITWIPKNLVADTESYYLEHNEADKINLVEEERIITLAKEIKAQRRRDDEVIMRSGRKTDEFFLGLQFSKAPVHKEDEIQEQNVIQDQEEIQDQEKIQDQEA